MGNKMDINRFKCKYLLNYESTQGFWVDSFISSVWSSKWPSMTGLQGQTHSGLSDHDSGPSISTKSANNNRVESPPRNSEPNLLEMGNFNSGHVCHIPQHASFPVYDSDSEHMVIDALHKTGRAG